ncbi:hypothetical protein ACO0LE_16365 [Undibacterium sp. Xuan67W]
MADEAEIGAADGNQIYFGKFGATFTSGMLLAAPSATTVKASVFIENFDRFQATF